MYARKVNKQVTADDLFKRWHNKTQKYDMVGVECALLQISIQFLLSKHNENLF